MKRCKKLPRKSLKAMPSPFGRTIASGYYDGPTEGFTECAHCGKTYAFRLLEWDDSQDMRIFSFADLDVGLDSIASRLSLELKDASKVCIVPPLALPEDNFVKKLLASQVTHV